MSAVSIFWCVFWCVFWGLSPPPTPSAHSSFIAPTIAIPHPPSPDAPLSAPTLPSLAPTPVTPDTSSHKDTEADSLQVTKSQNSKLKQLGYECGRDKHKTKLKQVAFMIGPPSTPPIVVSVPTTVWLKVNFLSPILVLALGRC